MKIECQQCHAGQAYLEAIVEHLKDTGDILQTVRCIRCGWRVSRPAPSTLAAPSRQPAKTAPPSDHKSAEWRAARAEDARNGAEKYRRPCKVNGCSGTYHATKNPLGLCLAHNKRLRSWQASATHKVAAPIHQINGVWIERGQALPGIA